MVLASGFCRALVSIMKTVQLETSGPQVSVPALRGRARKTRVDADAFIARGELVTASGETVSAPDPERYVHLQFRRFAGGPVCNLHLRSFVRRHDEIVKAGVREIVLFHSTAEELTVHALDLPFAVIADPHKRFYVEFGVEASKRSLLDPRAWLPIVRGVWRSLWGILFDHKPVPSLNPGGGRLGLPADLLIASDGIVVASKYGVHVYDQWSVDELLGLVASTNALPLKAQKGMIMKTKKLFVIGATGRTGREIVQQALARGHHVTAFVRSPENITLRNERLAILKGNPMDEDKLFDAIQNHDTVLSTLGPREVFKRSSMLHDSALATTRAMNRSGVKRLLVLSAAAHFPGVPNRIASFILRNHMRDSLAMEEIVQGSGLDWTIARPPRLTQEEYLTYRSREGAAPKMGFTLSRKAVAAFMLDTIEQKKHFQKIVGIAK